MSIPIYQYELQDGLSDLIQSNACVAYVSAVRHIHMNTNQLTQLQKLLESSASANPDQFDLYYLESILASLGWNSNDDVFTKEEMWNARHTPVDKPFNFMHNEKDIIGHLTSSKAVDFKGCLVPEDTHIDNLPNEFDVVVGSVLYKKWSDPKLQTRVDTLIQEIAEGKWCVSMECLFKNFDYAVKYEEGGQLIQKIVARNDETSFLTKHLRIYGGTGEYSGYKVGRLLRNFTFSGKGLVDNPANPRSHITNFSDNREVSSFAGTMATVGELKILKEEKTMPNEVVYTKEQYDALRAELDQVKAVSQEATKKEIDGLKTQIVGLTETNKALSTELEASKEVSKAKGDKIVTLETELTDTKTKLAEANKSIKETELKVVNAARKALLLERVDNEKAENLIQKFANASQEMFDALVDSLPKKAEETKAKMSEEEEKKMMEDKKKKKDSKASDDELETDIDDAKADEVAEMASGGTQEEVTLRTKAAAWFSSNVLRSTAKKQKE